MIILKMIITRPPSVDPTLLVDIDSDIGKLTSNIKKKNPYMSLRN